MANNPSWKWPQMETIQVENGLSWKRSKLEMASVGNDPSWKWPQLEMIQVGNGLSWKQSKLEDFMIACACSVLPPKNCTLSYL